jgi:hypothetical protein
MTIDEKITALLRTVCVRTYCDLAPVDTVRPYCTYQVIGGDAPQFLDAVVPTKKNADVQVTIWSDSRLEAAALMDQVEAAMIAATDMQASATGAAASDFDADMNVRSSRQDFNVWADR